MQKVYIDFDGTLFDTDKLYENFSKLCNKYGVPNEDIEQARMQVMDDYGLYSLEKILIVLEKKFNFNENFNKNFESLFSNEFVYNDVLVALDQLVKNHELILLTYSDMYQWHKIEASGLKKYFTNIIVTDKKKHLLDTIDYKNSIFIDNRVEDLENFYKVGAKEVYRIRRKSDKYSNISLNIKEIKEHINFLDLVKEIKK